MQDGDLTDMAAASGLSPEQISAWFADQWPHWVQVCTFEEQCSFLASRPVLSRLQSTQQNNTHTPICFIG